MAPAAASGMSPAAGGQAQGRTAYGKGGRYVRTEYRGTVSVVDAGTGSRREVPVKRTVYQNRDIDPAYRIPAGTKYMNGHTVAEDTTNIELMRDGKAPFIQVRDETGRTVLVQVELHHVSGRETLRGHKFFAGEERDGTMLEIPSTDHDKYSRQIHMGTPSFRKDREGKKSFDAKKYEKFRKQYWKDRAKQFLEK